NMYTQIAVTDKLGIIGGFDFGLQEKEKNSLYYYYWYSPVIIARYKIKNNLFAAFRYEYYEDKKGVIVPAAFSGGNEFVTSGYSVNVDYTPTSTIACRIEGRLLSASEDIFFKTNNFVPSNFFVTASVAIKFGKVM
ncbi:MAG: outer membrane beta-barrel protein, partial [Bacteroidia bacterium]